ncbi:hypothetical protein ACIQAC_23430 [Streptomyces sp. NPDC088387]
MATAGAASGWSLPGTLALASAVALLAATAYAAVAREPVARD